MSGHRIRVVLAVDHAVVRTGLRGVVLMDLSMPGTGGHHAAVCRTVS